ncbi:hypothetical protein [Acinetobacter variabilis]|uniref:hypothetical protein n=1 Tax=Acinetobacter variabilis TaxID=70346 RepID=UPI0028A0E774|nr:hypothetical protein [Acinetobacter variabilis]
MDANLKQRKIMGPLIESLSITANSKFKSDVDATFTLEVRNFKEESVVMLSRATLIPLSLEKIEIPENCTFVEMNKGTKDVSCPHDKDVVADVMILVLQHLTDTGWEFKKISIQSNQQLINYPKIVDAYSRNTEVIFN